MPPPYHNYHSAKTNRQSAGQRIYKVIIKKIKNKKHHKLIILQKQIKQSLISARRRIVRFGVQTSRYFSFFSETRLAWVEIQIFIMYIANCVVFIWQM